MHAVRLYSNASDAEFGWLEGLKGYGESLGVEFGQIEDFAWAVHY